MEDTMPEGPRRGRAPRGPERPSGERPSKGGPDVYLNVPELEVEEISLEVENLEAHVALSVQVLDMLKLNVGADVGLGAVKLDVKGVEAQACLEVRLDEVAAIVDRVLTTLDRNPQLLEHIGRGVESVGTGAGRAVGELGTGARGAVRDVGRGAGGAVRDVGEGTGGAVEGVGLGAAGAVHDVGRGAGGAAEQAGRGAGGAAESAGRGAGGAAERADPRAGRVGEETRGAGVLAADEDERPAPAGAGDERPAPAGAGDDRREPEGTGGGDTGDDGDGTERGADLRGALRETEESLQDLGRSLLRVFSR